MHRQTGCIALLALLFLGVPGTVYGESFYPHLRALTHDDPIYRQISDDIEAYYRYEKQGEGYLPPLNLYRYTPLPGEGLFDIAARLNLPYETLALLNGLEHPDDPITPGSILIPNLPGIFVSSIPRSELERIMIGWRDLSDAYPVRIDSPTGEWECYFVPGARFHPVERAYFLGILFRFPLIEGNISSRFGSRISPITGNLHRHNGVDIAAPSGTEVMAARDGRVIDLGYDDIFGNFILISHTQDYETLYGHLESYQVELNQEVNSGMIIGKVGSTGLSTGPHLHFEIRRKGEARDPSLLMPLF